MRLLTVKVHFVSLTIFTVVYLEGRYYFDIHCYNLIEKPIDLSSKYIWAACIVPSRLH